jgi:glutamate synthase domain-containing protein 3
MEFHLRGNIADSAFTAAYGGLLVVSPPRRRTGLSLVGSCFGYGARGGEAFIAGRAGNRFGICLRKNHEGGSPTLVVEGVGANAFQYMTGGTALVLGPTGPNLGSGMSGGTVYLLDPTPESLNQDYVGLNEPSEEDTNKIKQLLETHFKQTESAVAEKLLVNFDPSRFKVVKTTLVPEWLPEWSQEPTAQVL